MSFGEPLRADALCNGSLTPSVTRRAIDHVISAQEVLMDIDTFYDNELNRDGRSVIRCLAASL